MMVLEAINKSGDFIDIGCANGYLMESLNRWLVGTTLSVKFYGLDVSEDMLESAEKHLPEWQDRFFLDNGLDWDPPRNKEDVLVQQALTYGANTQIYQCCNNQRMRSNESA